MNKLYGQKDTKKQNLGHTTTFYVLKTFTTLGYFFEKILPVIKKLQKISGNKFQCPLISMILKDFEAQRFRDIRNSLAHWNFITKDNSIIFYSKREDGKTPIEETSENKACQYIPKEYTYAEIFAICLMTQNLSYAVLFAIHDEDEKRAH
jgi:hypothetical protein